VENERGLPHWLVLSSDALRILTAKLTGHDALDAGSDERLSFSRSQ